MIVSPSVDNSYFVYFNIFNLALYSKEGVTQFKFICAHCELLKNKLTDSSQPPPRWSQFHRNSKAQSLAQYVQFLLYFQCNNGGTNAPQYYYERTLPVLFNISQFKLAGIEQSL
jgi:hypothetical protein